MNQQPDKLFRDRLEHLDRPAPAVAWDRIENGLDKKNNKAVWWKVAASLLLLMVAGYVLWTQNPSSPTNTIALDKPVETPTKPNRAISPSKSSDPKEQAKKTAPVMQQAEENKPAQKNKKPKATHRIITPDTNTFTQHEATHKNENMATNHNEATPEINNEKSAPVVNNAVAVLDKPAAAAEPSGNRTLVFRADETDDYLNKNVVAEATDEDEKPSTFKKLLKKAQDLTNNQDPVGGLRQRKNEILALNFKSEKRGQNK